MRRVQLALAAVAVVLGTGAVLGHAPRAPAANALTAPPQTNCGDMAGPVWHVLPAGEQRGATGSHYTVTAIRMPCAQARALAAKMIRRPAPRRGFNRTILPGYTCLNTNAPGGSLFFIGGCIAGASAMPIPGATGFNWHHCQFVLATGAHPTCKWKYYKAS